ncbi:alpha-amylase family glycosyl hydrolase [Snuella sedimenti]|uniref:Alpha-amylase n=1 Tax=Snuella sedimenti TaxID=2798802 RepID=A0A8J7IHA7_9FLAO|nr:alpha-amylase family glycosyl hydrolase [Snuella sedimenti]MBJ6368268.1 alpha-amylase [Snuella sedimenti]
MKHLIPFLILTLLVCSCKLETKKTTLGVFKQDVKALPPITDTVLETAVIYEANIRQYSQEGSFNAFTKDIPQLKQLGVKIIWLMPVFPISETKRKATGGDFASLIEDETERKKMLGSYYAVSDYTKINPEFGTIQDFRELVKTAHQNGMYVILDWVPNHTGWDHVWLKTNPEFYMKNAKGEITDPLNADGTSKGWGDVAQLDYTNMDMQKAMIKDMVYWVENEDVDGFRCDHVEPTPITFWKKAIAELSAKKALFMLAENDDPKFMKANLFDMEYGWKAHHLIKEIVHNKKTLKDFDALMEYIDTTYESDDILMNFVTNHDENSWAGTVQERLGDASELATALTYVMPGMPLIYSGQEYNLNHRLKFFEKDTIPKTKSNMWLLLEKLGTLKATSKALHGSKAKASYKRLHSGNDQVLAFKRYKEDKALIFIGNFSDTVQTCRVPVSGNFIDYIDNNNIYFHKNNTLSLQPWEYKILVE